MTTDSIIPMTSSFEIMTKARAVREVAIEMEILHVFKGTEHYSPENYAPPEFVAAIKSSFSEIPPAFEQFAGPDAMEPLAETMTQLRNQLTSPVLGDVEYVEIQLSGWNGPPDGAAETFRKNFLGRLPDYLRNQVGLVNELDGALRAANNIAATSQQDLLRIADTAISSLLQTRFGSDGGGTDASDMLLKVVGVTASVVATVLGGAGPAMAFALAGQAANLAVDGIVPETVPAPAGATPRSIVKTMMSSIEKLVEATHAKEQALAAALQTDLEAARSLRATHLEPSFANSSCS